MLRPDVAERAFQRVLCHAWEQTLMILAALASPRQSVAFEAYFAFIPPALRRAARLPLLRARHNGKPCHSVAGQYWCDRCEQDINDLLLTGFDRLRTTQAGRPSRNGPANPCTRCRPCCNG